jgi:hypothetical protein
MGVKKYFWSSDLSLRAEEITKEQYDALIEKGRCAVSRVGGESGEFFGLRERTIGFSCTVSEENAKDFIKYEKLLKNPGIFLKTFLSK